MSKLTPKQEKFCQRYVLLGDKSAAYREAYSTSKMKPGSINVNASKLCNNAKVALRIEELRSEINKKNIYTLEASVRRDIKLIERYEKALDVLEDRTSSEEDIEAAERTIKFIGSSGYNSAQDRLSKQHGFYERDNEQKAAGDTRTPEEREARINELIAKHNAK